MAGDWIKMRVDLHTHPKVVRMSSALNADRLRVVGGLHAVWCLFDAHSEDGSLEGYSPAVVDDLIGFSGFSEAMVKVGWLQVEQESVALPRFDDHNGSSAKRRAMESDRKRKDRDALKSAQTVPDLSAIDADKSRTREEKRRGEVIEPNGSVDKADRLPVCNRQAVVDLYHEILPELPQVRVMNDARGKQISSRWKWILTSKKPDGTRRAETAEEALGWLRQFFELAKQNDFLMGRGFRSQGHQNWQADIDFLMTDRGLKHVVEKTGGAQ